MSGIEIEAVVALLVPRNRRTQLAYPVQRRILVVPGFNRPDCGLLDRVRPVDVWEPLPKVDRPGSDGKRRHLREDRARIALQAGVEVRNPTTHVEKPYRASPT